MPNLTTSRQHTARCQVLTLFPQRHRKSSVCECVCACAERVCASQWRSSISSPHADSQQRHPHHRRLHTHTHTHRPRVVRSTANVPVTRPKYHAETAPGTWLGLVGGAMPWSRVRVTGLGLGFRAGRSARGAVTGPSTRRQGPPAQPRGQQKQRRTQRPPRIEHCRCN